MAVNTMVCRVDDSPVAVTGPKRLNYFPPIAAPATMFQRRQKKSARELYDMCPQNHDLILTNPPVTPWDEPQEFFRNFIGTPDDVRRAGLRPDPKATWPYLRQIGPKCVFKGMRKKAKDDENVLDIYKLPAASRVINERFLEPECIGIAREYASPRSRFFPLRSSDPQSVCLERQSTFTAPLKHGNAATSQKSSAGKVNAPPPSEARSAKSDDSLPDTGIGTPHHKIAPIFDPAKNLAHRAFRVGNAKAAVEAYKKKDKRPSAAGERVVRFEDSPLPDKLQNANVANPESLNDAQMLKLTWHDIVQAPVVGTLISVSGLSYVPAGHARRVPVRGRDGAGGEGRVPWRLPRTNRGFAVAMDNMVADREKRVGMRVSDREIASWIDDVRKAQSYGGGISVSR